MVNVDEAPTIDELIQRLARTTNLPLADVEAAVARMYGEDISDLVPDRPLTEVERRRLGLGRSAAEPRTPRRALAASANRGDQSA